MQRDLWFSGHRVELPEMLAGREARAEHQRELLGEADDVCLVCFTVNIPGPVKQCAASLAAFEAGKRAVEDALSGGGGNGGAAADESATDKAENVCFDVVKKEICCHEYGGEGFWLVKAGALDVKKALARVEETHPLGRLFDMDVLRSDGTKVSRGEIGLAPRRCLICGGNAADCAGGRVHSVEELQDEICRRVIAYLRRGAGETDGGQRDRGAAGDGSRVMGLAGYMAYSAMIAEVQTTPKPGLVDRENCGSHTDMDLRSFEKSAHAIYYYFGDCCEAGAKARAEGLTQEELFPRLRAMGLAAERAMIRAANANTHKGLIFSLGIICGAWGYCRATGESRANANDHEDPESRLFETAARIASPAAEETTQQGLRRAGARAEAASGFPTLRAVALPAFRRALAAGLDTETAGLWCLLRVIAETADTNMIKRGGRELAERMRAETASAVRTLDGDLNADRIKETARRLDERFTALGLSPGGCADILAITCFIELLKDITTEGRGDCNGR